ncbi:MAG TPA: hypothetical protein VMR49_02790 [Candidatus Paceibacterota bacterium]|jgi:hypothetical protein|nr:hypothetical protein [Candidatus Paceibacterota bacterium]
MEFKRFNPFTKKEKEDDFEKENKQKILEVLSFIKELANDSIFENRKKYHVNGTQPVNLLDRISRPLVGLNGLGNVDSARVKLSEIVQGILEKAESQNNEDIEKIRKILDLLNQPDIFSRPDITLKISDQISLFDFKPQVILNRSNEKSKIIEKQDYWEKPDPSLN